MELVTLPIHGDMRPDTPPPRFGTADLSNCERELIHLPGSIQPHGVLLVLRESDLTVLQASANLGEHFGVDAGAARGLHVGRVDGGLAAALEAVRGRALRHVRHPVRFRRGATARGRPYLGLVHRHPEQGFRVELEPRRPPRRGAGDEDLLDACETFLQRVGAATGVAAVAGQLVRGIRTLTGYDRVMVYRFDREGRGEVMAEDREEELESFLGLRYPASDIPRRARRLYVRNRLRLLVDVDYDPVPMVPRDYPATGDDLDMSLCYLRSMSPIHLQYLRNMGVTGTLVTSLVVEGELWGLVACHHYSPRNVAYEVRAACGLVSEVAAARLGMLENRARTEAEVQVRELEARLIRSTSREGDWRRALLEDPGALLDPLEASGAALFYDGSIETVGEAPPRPLLRRIRRGVTRVSDDRLFQTDAVELDLPGIEDVGPELAGILAVELSATDDEYLMWFRPEQVHRVRWGGDPRKPVVVGDDPEDLSPRRSFAAWTELVRDRSAPWEDRHLELASVLGESLRDVIGQVRAMRLLLTERETRRLRRQLQDASTPLLLASGDGDVLFLNASFARLLPGRRSSLDGLDEVPELFRESRRIRALMQDLRERGRPFQDEVRLQRRGEGTDDDIPVAVRMDPIPAPAGPPIGYVLLVADLRERRRRERARRELERTVRGPLAGDRETMDDRSAASLHVSVSSVLLSVASAARSTAPDPDIVEGLEVSARRARTLSRILLDFTGGEEPSGA